MPKKTVVKKQAANKMEVTLVRALLAASTTSDSNQMSLHHSGKTSWIDSLNQQGGQTETTTYKEGKRLAYVLHMSPIYVTRMQDIDLT